jgi:hypothetical protein
MTDPPVKGKVDVMLLRYAGVCGCGADLPGAPATLRVVPASSDCSRGVPLPSGSQLLATAPRGAIGLHPRWFRVTRRPYRAPPR